MDTMDAAGLPWKIDSTKPVDGGYSWAICPTFSDCLYTSGRT